MGTGEDWYLSVNRLTSRLNRNIWELQKPLIMNVLTP